MATVLAEPNLIAMSGETASFLAGSEIPLIVPQAGTSVGTITVQYKQVGVMLAFTPTIIGDRINLKVAPEVSELSAAGSVSVPLTPTAVVTVPAITTRKASTTIELGSGQSFAIAGLLHRTSLQDITKFPWLGDVPVLGTLFKSDAYQREETELVIIITPYLVEPTSGQLRTPLTDRVPPTDVDRLVMQRFNHPTPPRRLVGRPRDRAGRPDRRLHRGVGATMRSAVVLAGRRRLAACAQIPSPSRPPPIRASIRCAPTPWWRSISRPAPARPMPAQASALRTMVAAGRRAQRDEFVVVSDGSGGPVQRRAPSG